MNRLLLKSIGLCWLLVACNNTVTLSPEQEPDKKPISTTPTTTPTNPASKASPEIMIGGSQQPSSSSQAPSSQAKSSCNYSTGVAVTGQPIAVDLCSLKAKNSGAIGFIYYLGDDRVESEANCATGTWTTFPEGQVNRPQSSATQQMLDTVCGYRSSDRASADRAGVAVVFDPPSNVRATPNGEILCSIKTKATINIYGSIGSWYYTNICGVMGVISANQIRF